MKNVVMISVDDLFNVVRFRDAYGVSIQTPNIDRLLERSVYFDNAHAIMPACNPSRASTMTGLSHYKVGVTKNTDTFFNIIDPTETISYAFKTSGYQTVGNGKIFHGGIEEGGNPDGKIRFLEKAFDLYVPSVGDITGAGNGATVGHSGPGPLLEEEHADTNAAQWAAEYLRDNVNSVSPYFLAVGLHKPHLYWNVPHKYYDLYDPALIVTPDVPIDDYEDVPLFYQHVMQGLRDLHARVVGADEWVDAIHSYLAAISYADAQIGKIVDALDETGSWDSTTVILWSDHGYHLGDKEAWGKFTHWENATNAPLIISDPSIAAKGEVVATPVSLMDIFPTLLELTGIEDPGPSRDGNSLVPLLKDPNGSHDGLATSVFDGSISLRSNVYRYIISITGEEQLYNMEIDPEQRKNLAVGGSEFTDILNDFRAMAQSEASRLGLLTDFESLTIFGSNTDEWVLISDNIVSAFGGRGNDSYIIHRISDVEKIIEQENEGVDLVNYISTKPGQHILELPVNIEDFEWRGVRGSLVLTGNSSSNNIYASGGHDVIALLAGDDVAVGQGGNDEISGSFGDDTIFGNDGDDTIYGGDGLDQLRGGDGNDLIAAGNQHDNISAGSGDDTVHGGRGRDHVTLGNGDDRFFDFLQDGYNGVDYVFGENGNDTIHGLGGDDYFDGGWHEDSISGGEGADTIYGRLGRDTLSGQNGGDYLDGGYGDDIIFGGGGYDTINSGAGEDFVFGGYGRDDVKLGDGHDVFQDIDQEGFNGRDIVFGENGNDTIFGAGGDDDFDGGWGSDSIQGGVGDDKIHGAIGRDTIFGGTGRDSLDGGNDDDAIWGNFGDDDIFGGGGDDRIFGGVGNDTINGGKGNDSLRGEIGIDCFEFVSGWGHDTIRDFDPESETISWAAWGGRVERSLLTIVSQDGGVLIYFSGNSENTVFLENVSLDSINANSYGVFAFI